MKQKCVWCDEELNLNNEEPIIIDFQKDKFICFKCIKKLSINLNSIETVDGR